MLIIEPITNEQDAQICVDYSLYGDLICVVCGKPAECLIDTMCVNAPEPEANALLLFCANEKNVVDFTHEYWYLTHDLAMCCSEGCSNLYRTFPIP